MWWCSIMLEWPSTSFGIASPLARPLDVLMGIFEAGGLRSRTYFNFEYKSENNKNVEFMHQLIIPSFIFRWPVQKIKRGGNTKEIKCKNWSMFHKNIFINLSTMVWKFIIINGQIPNLMYYALELIAMNLLHKHQV